MTLDEMIEELQRFKKMHPYAGKYPVCVRQNAHDYWRTNLVPEVKAIDEGFSEPSSYHDTDKEVDPMDVEPDDDSVKAIVVFRTNSRW